VSNRRATRAFDVSLSSELARSCGIILLVIELIAISLFIVETHGWITQLEHPISSDFVSHYVAGALTNGETPHLNMTARRVMRLSNRQRSQRNVRRGQSKNIAS
jgi:hypothetical protein